MRTVLFILLALFVYNSSAQTIATINGNSVTINNSSIEATIEGGRMTSLNQIGQPNVLNNGGYGYFSYVDNVGFYSPSTLTPVIKINTEEIADFYYEITDNINVEMHYVFRKNESGFFVYFIVSDAGLIGKTLRSLRFALRVDKEVFNYAWTTEREGEMIHPDELANYVEEIQDATYLLQDGTIYTKYDWAVDKYRDYLHGLMGNGAGLWNIEASHEYSNSGPTAQELTLHGTDTTPILLSQFFSEHYGGESIELRDEYTSWTKIFGPHFIYINSGANDAVLADAKLKASDILEQWPFSWLNHSIFPLDRGTLTGRLKINGHGQVDSAMVFLCKSGPGWLAENDHWQKQPYDYMFWTEADASGNFFIDHIRPGTYTLYAYTQKGKLIDELRADNITILAGSNTTGRTLLWDANDKQKTIFQIGTADHKSGEFKLADLPRAYGRWKDCPYTLTYDVNKHLPQENWYYCQRVGSLWQISFNIEDLSAVFYPTLKVGIAGNDVKPHLEIILNGSTISTTDLGTDSGIRRSSLTGGKFSMITCSVDKDLLVAGTNTLEMKCYGSAHEYKGIMYDAILLEADTVDQSTFADSPLLSSKPQIKIYQSSVSGSIEIKADTNLEGISILDLSGHKVYTRYCNQVKSVTITDFKNPTGIYLVQFRTADKVYTHKLFYKQF